jgi:Cytosol aminopeptidase family, N-terminal domain
MIIELNMSNYPTKQRCRYFAIALLFLTVTSTVFAESPVERTVNGPNAQTISVKMIGPVTQVTDLQIICILKHDPSGDRYLDAMKELNEKLHGVIAALRDRGEFAGDRGETLLFNVPADSIAPKRVLLIGVGDETAISPETFNFVGRIAAREAVRLGASHVSFAPMLRDQGSDRVDVGDGDAAFIAGWILAYDTEKRLQQQQLAPPSDVASLTIEAGPKFFDAAVAKLSIAVQTAADALGRRDAKPYLNP